MKQWTLRLFPGLAALLQSLYFYLRDKQTLICRQRSAAWGDNAKRLIYKEFHAPRETEGNGAGGIMMNKRSGKTNGLAQRLLALLLCCVCLVAIMPVYAIASNAEAAAVNSVTETETATESEKQPADENKIDNSPAEIKSEDDDKTDSTTSENTEVTEDKTVTGEDTVSGDKTEPAAEETGDKTEPDTDTASKDKTAADEEKTEGETTEETEEESEKTDAEKLYDRIMACETADAYNELIASLTEEELALMDEFTEEQNEALTEKMTELGVYEAAAAVAYEGKLTITDNITTNGCLKVSGTDLDGKTVTYKWFKSTDGTTYTEVERKKITGESYNVADDGSWINVALDGGARCYYKAEVATIDGVAVESSTESNVYQVPYYTELRNGSFETPAISIGQSDKDNPVYGGGDVIWNTTATDSLIEIVAPGNSASSVFKWHGVKAAQEGKQCAEINAEQSSALYQDVLTVPGSTMYWQLSHLGRTMNDGSIPSNGAEGSDTMYVLIMPYDQAQKITTQADVNYVINNMSLYPDAQVTTITYTWSWKTETESSGKRSTTYNVMQHKVGEELVDTYKYKEGDPSSVEQLADPWEVHSGNYTVPTGQYLTRYFFVAGNTATGNDTVGNHIDNVWFSTDIPPANPGSANLTIKKTINVDGWDEMKDDQKSAFQNAVSFTYGPNGTENAVAPDKIVWKDNVGTFQVNVSLGSAASVDYKVKETLKDVEDYVWNGNTETDLTKSVTLADKGSATAEFTNSYSLANKNLTIAKTVSGNMADTKKTFKFTVKADKEMTLGEVTNTSFEFDLANGQSTTISVPVGAAVTVTEDHAGYVYSLKAITGITDYTDNKENGISFTMPNADSTVTFNNNKDVSIDTGVTLDSLPYVLILAVVVAGAVIVLRKRRSRDED